MFSNLPSCGKPTRLLVYDLHTLQASVEASRGRAIFGYRNSCILYFERRYFLGCESIVIFYLLRAHAHSEAVYCTSSYAPCSFYCTWCQTQHLFTCLFLFVSFRIVWMHWAGFPSHGLFTLSSPLFCIPKLFYLFISLHEHAASLRCIAESVLPPRKRHRISANQHPYPHRRAQEEQRGVSLCAILTAERTR